MDVPAAPRLLATLTPELAEAPTLTSDWKCGPSSRAISPRVSTDLPRPGPLAAIGLLVLFVPVGAPLDRADSPLWLLAISVVAVVVGAVYVKSILIGRWVPIQFAVDNIRVCNVLN